MKIPNFITHYYLAERQPFLTLSELEMCIFILEYRIIRRLIKTI
ncbi:MAG: hypothetical protein AAFQ91_06065 [Cyanobacteria bacterium J06621_15]